MAVPDKNIITPSPSADNSIANVGVAETALASQSAQADIDSAQRQQEAAQANITNDDMFPGMDQKINVGSSTSQTLGTQPIFVAAGQYVPYNILNKKEEAIAEASKKRAARQAKFDPGKAGKLTNQLYQRGLNDDFNKMNSEFIKTAQTISPDNWDVMLNDPGSEIGKLYAQQKSNFEVLATESNVIFDKAANVIKNKEVGGDVIHSPETQKLAYEVQNRTTDAVSGKLGDLRPFVDKFNGSYDLDAHLAKNKVVSQMKADITALLTPEHGGLTVEETHDWTERIKAYAKSETATAAGRYHDDNIIKEQDIIDRLSSMLGIEKTKKHKYKPQVSAAAGKGKTAAERAQQRYKTIKRGSLDPSSPEAIALAESLAGSKYAGGIVTKSSMSSPDDYTEIRSASTNLTDFYDQNKDAVNKGKIWDTKRIETSEFKEELLNKFNSELSNAGLEGDLQSVSIDKNNTNLIHVVGPTGLKETIDMSKEDAIENFYLGDAAKYKDTNAVKLTYEKGGRTKTAYLDLNKRASFREYNTILNSTIGEDLKVDQEVINEMYDAEIDQWEGKKKSKLIKNQGRIDKDAAIKAKKEAERKAAEAKKVSRPATLEDLKKDPKVYAASVAKTAKQQNVSNEEAEKMIANHYNNKK
jgi:hypothetical protein